MFGRALKSGNRRSHRWPWVCGLLLLCWLGLCGPAWAVSLGDPLPEWAKSMQVGRQRLRGVEHYQGQEQIRAYGNQAGRVFWIQIESSADLPPDPRQYLGSTRRFQPRSSRWCPCGRSGCASAKEIAAPNGKLWA